MSKLKFKDLLDNNCGITKGPFGGDIKKAYFVPKGVNTYKVYEQGVVYEKDIKYGNYYIDYSRFEKLKKFEVLAGDILLTGAGTLGELFVVPEEHERGVINQALIRIRLNPNVIDKDYFLFYFKWYIKNIVCRINGDSVIPNLPPLSVIKETDVNIPSLKKQKKIAKTLKLIENKISNNIMITAKLEAMAKTIYDYWFLQYEFPNEEGKPYKSSGGKMVYNEELKKEIPEGWEITTIGNITKCHDSERIPISNKERESMKGNIPYYGATGIMGYVNRPIFNGDYVLMAEDGSVMNEKGNPILQRVSGPIWVNNHAHVLEPLNEYSCKLLMMILKDIPVDKIKTGSIQMKINQQNMNKYKVVQIPNRLKKDICVKLDIIDKKIIALDKENEELTKLRDELLPLLMNGQVSFKN